MADKTFVFDYDTAYSRNIGWVTRAEQEKLKNARVGIAGLGGVGGAHLRTLTRLGLTKFHISDFDEFDIHNLNRQAAATMPNMGRKKLDAAVQMATDINPEVELKLFPKGVLPENVDEFLNGVDIYVDGLDFFALPARRMVFAKCREKGIPVLTAAPLGIGAATLYFSSTGMSAEDYFKWDGHPIQEQYARFVAGLSPAMLARDYLVAPEAVNFKERRGPSTIMACDLCAGLMGALVFKVLLGRGALRAAPWGMHFDAYHQKLKFTWRPMGNSNPLQWVLLKLIRRVFNAV